MYRVTIIKACIIPKCVLYQIIYAVHFKQTFFFSFEIYLDLTVDGRYLKILSFKYAVEFQLSGSITVNMQLIYSMSS